ncbi:hypothetical protein MUG94_08130 [Arthrobacter gengyunqii]|uniref:Uncharacterized protein n=1 Tax=Arthrobacter gengyunqii TaxID=2886940 RepID=A0A9X1S5J9_9MICC|nr:hypothetical protein [Arthrobacter gengyunqii]MCC3269485.1 hypothetical protein [Arthrobacter gengyunqii]UOY97677.1 hypothetical protein MUG94_08130 [Arthrobacter gengyunqii]
MSEAAGEIREREQAAVRALNEQEDYVRRMGHLSDEELTRQLVATLRQEKTRLDRWIDSGECFILSSAGKIHLPQCPSMRQFMDRDAAWKPYLDDLDRVRDWHGSDNAPDMPTLLTRAEVEGLKAYKTCSVCAPTLDHTDKRPGLRGWTVLKCGSLKTKHFGKYFSFVAGEEMGVLTRISTVETIGGLEFRAEFDGLDDPVTDPSVEVMYPTPRPSTWPPLDERN